MPQEQLSRLQEIASTVHARFPLAQVPWAFGRKHLKNHGHQRRIIWCRTRTPIVPSHQAGARLATDNKVKVSAWMREESAVVFLYAESDGAVSELVDLFIATAGKVLGTNLKLASIDWPSQDDGEAGETRRTECAALSLLVHLPVVESENELKANGTYADTCGTIQDDGSIKPQTTGDP